MPKRKKQKALFEVMIRWGSCEPIRNRTITEYRFDTLKELNAFLEGVDEAVGWLDHEQIDNPVACKGCKIIFDSDSLNDGYCSDCTRRNADSK